MSEYTIILGLALVVVILFDVYAYYRYRFAEEVLAAAEERKNRGIKHVTKKPASEEEESGLSDFDEFDYSARPQEKRAREARAFGETYFVGSRHADSERALLEMSEQLESLSERVESLRSQLAEALGTRGDLRFIEGVGFREVKDVASTDDVPEVSFKEGEAGGEGEETRGEKRGFGREITSEDEPEDEEFGRGKEERGEKGRPRKPARVKKTRRK